jgi:hypothetical protein
MRHPEGVLMDMSEFRPAGADARWCELVGQLGSEAAAPLTAALERVSQLTATGRIDRPSLRALRDELERARRVAMLGQQLARFATGVRQNPERLNLAQLLRQAVAQRRRETEARGVQFRQVLTAADVVVDASLLFALLNAVLDWSLAHARSSIEFRLDHRSSPAHARLACRFSHRPPDAAGLIDAASLDSLPWRLAQQIAWAMGVAIERHDDASQTALVLEFPSTVGEGFDAVTAVEYDPAAAVASAVAKTVAGSQVLVLSARAEIRARVRDAVRHMGLMIDFVASVEEARDFCREGLPHALVYESSLAGDRFEALHAELLRDAPTLAFIELGEEGDAFAVSGFGGAEVAHVGREAIATGLPSALVFELSRSL